MRRIGLMGGTFDPIHNGHLHMARAAKTGLALESVRLIPAGSPPHKHRAVTDAAHRLTMAELATHAEPGLFVSDMETQRLGKTYTVDTLRAFWAQEPADYVFILGADSLMDLPNWREPEALASLCAFAVLPRKDADMARAREAAEAMTARFGARITFLDTPIPGISSTTIRARVHGGISLTGLTPSAVADYIGEHRLYDPPALRTLDEMQAILRETLSPERFEHVVSTMHEAETYAKRFGADPAKARIAGLLHDCAHDMTLDELREQAVSLSIEVDPLYWNSVGLLHAPVGAALARARFGVTDPEILKAIEEHNTGATQMGTLDRILYLADKIEPARKPYPGLEQARALVQRDLRAALIFSMSLNLAYMESIGNAVHPTTVAALSALRLEASDN